MDEFKLARGMATRTSAGEYRASRPLYPRKDLNLPRQTQCGSATVAEVNHVAPERRTRNVDSSWLAMINML